MGSSNRTSFTEAFIALLLVAFYAAHHVEATAAVATLIFDEVDQFQCAVANDCPEVNNDFSAFCASDNRCGYIFNKPNLFSKPVENNAKKPDPAPVAAVGGAGGAGGGEFAVVDLTQDDFYAKTKEGAGDTAWAIKFFAPWCGHCKKMAPAWEELAQHYADNEAVEIASVDCTQHAEVCADFGVRGYPTIQLVKGGVADTAVKYQGPRTVEEFTKWVDREA